MATQALECVRRVATGTLVPPLLSMHGRPSRLPQMQHIESDWFLPWESPLQRRIDQGYMHVKS